MALLARATRASLLEVLAADYVRTARSKGLRESLVIRRHALRNALIPVVTIGGILLAEVLVGSFYVETVFAIPGIGRYFVTSVTSRDYPVLMGVTLLMTTVVALVNLFVDLTYAYLDPRIRYG
jgi:ABC-type dipeptide/oligopeptide/nickel transport system permease component